MGVGDSLHSTISTGNNTLWKRYASGSCTSILKREKERKRILQGYSKNFDTSRKALGHLGIPNSYKLGLVGTWGKSSRKW
jgi:hypothetical protein